MAAYGFSTSGTYEDKTWRFLYYIGIVPERLGQNVHNCLKTKCAERARGELVQHSASIMGSGDRAYHS